MKLPRFRFDTPDQYGLVQVELPTTLNSRNAALGNGVRVSDRILGRIAQVIHGVERRIGLSDHIECFVTSSGEVSAQCSRTASGVTVIFLSSQLVTLLDDVELAFVVGHELGHSLLGHHEWVLPSEQYVSARSLEGIRAMEFSADRIGVIASGDVDASVRAMAKTASGLRTIVEDMSILDYVRQERDARVSDGYADIVAASTHPPLVTRARASLRFVTACHADFDLGSFTENEHDLLDGDIRQEMDTIFSSSESFASESLSAAFWIALEEAKTCEALSASKAGTYEEVFGERLTNSYQAFARDMAPDDLRAHIAEKARGRREEVARSVTVLERRVNEIVGAVNTPLLDRRK